jgi:hypothetical protein
MMDYIALAGAIVAGTLSVLHRKMVAKIYTSDGRALSVFTLPRIIRREYKARFGEDALFWTSRLLPLLLLLLVAAALAITIAKV